VVILEITTPTKPPLSTFFRLWFDRLVPALGKVAGDPDAYTYLPNSVKRFPDAPGLAAVPRPGGPRRRRVGAHRRRHHRDAPRPGARALSAPVAHIVAAGGPHIAPLLARVEEVLASVASSHGAVLAEHAQATIDAGGKRLRPLLVLLTAGPDAPAEPAVRAAASVELVHSATLVHDDVLDDAPAAPRAAHRLRHRGRRMAIATGDLLFSRAFAVLVENRDAAQIRSLSRASSALAQGELLQRADAWNAAVPVERYLRRCELKTARLFEAACELGALVAGEDTGALGRFGRRIGLAFQLLDDVLDVSGPAERTGKHRGTDLLDGTVTLPLILARERDAELAAVDPRAITTPQRAEEVCDAIAATGALGVARERALGYVAEAKDELPDLPQRRALELVADSVVDRFA
jgi:geranylgeranyl pyrophosphate synthase